MSVVKYYRWKVVHHVDNPASKRYAAIRCDDHNPPALVGDGWFSGRDDAIKAVRWDREITLSDVLAIERLPVEFTHR